MRYNIIHRERRKFKFDNRRTGLTRAEYLAKQLNISVKRFNYLLDNLNTNEKNIEIFKEYIESQKTYQEIAQEQGVSRERIHYICNDITNLIYERNKNKLK
jgi:DNA-directed RNA polymerase sigma subunit (sigma70/sigma32)